LAHVFGQVLLGKTFKAYLVARYTLSACNIDKIGKKIPYSYQEFLDQEKDRQTCM
jgi:hypothetical protein